MKTASSKAGTTSAAVSCSPRGANDEPALYTGPALVAEGGPEIRFGVGRQRRVVEGPGCYPATSGPCNVGTCVPWTFNPPSYVIEDAASFNQWYTTVEGVNMEVPLSLELKDETVGSGIVVYDSAAFFPLDGMGFGNTPGQQHN